MKNVKPQLDKKRFYSVSSKDISPIDSSSKDVSPTLKTDFSLSQDDGSVIIVLVYVQEDEGSN